MNNMGIFAYEVYKAFKEERIQVDEIIFPIEVIEEDFSNFTLSGAGFMFAPNAIQYNEDKYEKVRKRFERKMGIDIPRNIVLEYTRDSSDWEGIYKPEASFRYIPTEEEMKKYKNSTFAMMSSLYGMPDFKIKSKNVLNIFRIPIATDDMLAHFECAFIPMLIISYRDTGLVFMSKVRKRLKILSRFIPIVFRSIRKDLESPIIMYKGKQYYLRGILKNAIINYGMVEGEEEMKYAVKFIISDNISEADKERRVIKFLEEAYKKLGIENIKLIRFLNDNYNGISNKDVQKKIKEIKGPTVFQGITSIGLGSYSTFWVVSNNPSDMKAFGSNSNKPLPYIDPVVLLDNRSEFNKLIDMSLSNISGNINTDTYNTSNIFNRIDTRMDDGTQYLNQNKYGCHEWALKSWEKATERGIIDGSRPKDPLTREELITILDRARLFDLYEGAFNLYSNYEPKQRFDLDDVIDPFTGEPYGL